MNLKDMSETLILGDSTRERFIRLDSPDSSALRSLAISMAGLSALDKSYRVVRVSPKYHVVLYTLGGNGMLTQETTRTEIRKATVIFLPAGSVYEYAAGENGWRIAWFHLGQRKQWREVAKRGAQIARDYPCVRIGALTEFLLDDQLADRPEESALLAALIRKEIQRSLKEPGGVSSHLDERMRNTRRRIEESPAHPWTVAELARMTAVSQSHLHRLALEHWGMAPMKFVTNSRVERGAALLRHTDLTVEQIAQSLGYADPFSFSHAFRRVMGQSPAHLRNNKNRF